MSVLNVYREFFCLFVYFTINLLPNLSGNQQVSFIYVNVIYFLALFTSRNIIHLYLVCICYVLFHFCSVSSLTIRV